MTKLGKYLKPFALSILAIVALLFTQAMCELAMPDYMSSIVDVGIVSGGVEDGVPSVIRESEVKKLVLFMDKKEQKVFTDNYTKITSAEATADQLDAYPILKKENVYELKDVDSATRDTIKESLRKAETTVMGLEQSAAEAKSGKTSSSKDLSDEQEKMMKLLTSLPKGMDIFTVLETMPSKQLMDMKQEMNKVTDAMGAETADTANATYVRNEYKTIGVDVDAIQYTYLIQHGLMMLAVALGSAAAAVAVGFLAARVAAGVSRNLRKDVFNKVEHFSSAEFNKFSTNTLITRTTNDIQQIQMALVMILRIVIYAPIIGIGAVIKVVNTNVSMTWIIALVVVLILSIMMVAFAFVMPKFKMLQKLMDKLNSVVREILDGMPVIRAFNNQKCESEKFAKANGDILKTNLFTTRAMACLMPLVMLIMNCASVLIVWVGSHQIDSGALQVGDMMAFIQYAIQIIMAFMMITMISIMLPRASAAAQRAMEVLHTEPTICDPKTAERFDDAKRGCIEFHNVSFRYPGAEEDVLHDISFTAQPGETTAFIGSTGSGKSTIINLVPRFFDVTEGSILVDGVDVRRVSQHDLREKIGYVPQKGSLFTGTIASNLRYAKEDATAADMEEAASIAQALDFIDEKQERFDTPIAQGGTNVSGGQRQRLSIARALVKKPEIYIFDDTFSALDFKTDARLRKALNELCQETRSTVLLVAQRISSIMHAQRIVVLDKGQVAGIGTHEELMKSCDVYKEIAYSQLSKEELENE
ncbi:ABC transporter ATP-binding protein/permease [[Clostridium] innocuum]|nr:ABC transporter ATP-binding protein [Erysipelotrichaceae bacterium]MCR0384401.1 ABC transporter ATP-binding protein/permease [[Clostridium] innocuum]MCR0413293.1 ABC transporter ATP-binding protein/permease [[Clostridium] innocuum]MCR0533427.1 ABC transporter ATP-binding protein/permease [[Clostridium] innocuum]MCR0537493.1 ABC transporter ATP-binding protein/permease [[Clostridium] innocuum]